MTADEWQTATVGDVRLAYRASGSGEPVVFVHAGVVADWFTPLLDAPILAERHRLVTYHRVNYGRSEHLDRPVSIAEQAAHLRELLEQLGIRRAHVVGHSAGASVALQLAMDGQDCVGTLAVLDPALSTTPATGLPGETVARGPSAADAERAGTGASTGPSFIAEAMRRYAEADRTGAVDVFMSGVCGPEYRAGLTTALGPDFFEQAVADADGLFQSELPALRDWRPAPEEVGRISVPVLVAAGTESPPVFAERQRLLLAWLPDAEAFTLPGAGHLLQAQQPGRLADALADFFGRHPLGAVPG